MCPYTAENERPLTSTESTTIQLPKPEAGPAATTLPSETEKIGVPSAAAMSMPRWPPSREPNTSEMVNVPIAMGSVRAMVPPRAVWVAVTLGACPSACSSAFAAGATPGSPGGTGAVPTEPSRLVSAHGSSTEGITTTSTSAMSATIRPSTPHSRPFTSTATTSAGEGPRRGRAPTRGALSRAPSSFVEGAGQGPVHLRDSGQWLVQHGHAPQQRDHVHAFHTRALRGAHPVAHRVRVHADLLGHRAAGLGLAAQAVGQCHDLLDRRISHLRGHLAIGTMRHQRALPLMPRRRSTAACAWRIR